LVVSTSGQAAPDAEVRIVDPDGRVLGPNEAGEIVVRTGRMMREYLDDPAATRAAMTEDGWLRTGDIGTLDELGYIRITDRLKDMYITNGFNVYPAEIERLIGGIAGVAHCAVVGLADARRGEVGHAFIIRAPGSTLTADEVLAWCKVNIAGYKNPAGVTFVDDFPRNSVGKLLKRELKGLL
jgi:acyl-CoA synthetase (AMP-forming)/AMP-acid ligase II